MSESGHISIHAENILPIIKKWLYSEKEIFLRELLANASDAIQKLQKIALVETISAEIPEPNIRITIDEKAGTLTISDTGIGMTADEVKKYINQVAFSGVKDFVARYQGKEDQDQIIGHFGLGFYSSFMAAQKVEIDSLSFKDGSEPVRWSCDGSTAFTLEKGSRQEIGTSIILYIDGGSREMLNAANIERITKKFCQFLRYPIYLGEKQINHPIPLWTKNPSQVSENEYLDFYRELFPGDNDPLFWIHLNVDHPFRLKGVLYFPRLRHELDASQGEVKLFCNQVFVADNSKELIPEFLTLLKGAIDCADLPLNVSRSYLQQDNQSRMITSHIVKKVADKLVGLAKTEKETFEKYWDDIHPFVKFGMLRDNTFYERLEEHVLFKKADGKYTTLKEYEEGMKDKTSNTVIYCTDPHAQGSYVRMLKDQGIDVLIAGTLIDQHFLPWVEMQSRGRFKFKRVDADLSDLIVDKQTNQAAKIIDPKDQKSADEKIAELFGKHLPKDIKIKVETLKSSGIPAILTVDENMRRLKEMSRMTNNRMNELDFPEAQSTLIINHNSPVIKKILNLSQTFNREEDVVLMIQHVFDLAQLQQGQPRPDVLQEFLSRSNALLERWGSTTPVS